MMINIVRPFCVESHTNLSLSFFSSGISFSRLLFMICRCDREVRVLTVVSIQSVGPWVVTPSNLGEGYKCLEQPAVSIFKLKE